MPLKPGNGARYAVPVVLAGVIALGAAVPSLSGAALPPKLGPVSAQTLLGEVIASQGGQFSGTLTWQANVGLSDLQTLEDVLGGDGSPAKVKERSSGGGFNFVSLLSGTYQVDAWVDGARAERLAVISGPADEVDLVRAHNHTWIWDSSNGSVEDLVGNPLDRLLAGLHPGGAAGFLGSALLPGVLAQYLLKKAESHTTVALGPSVFVAGEPAYQLVVSPKDAPSSTVRRVQLAVGATGELEGTVLRLAIFARRQHSAALQVGFDGHLTADVPGGGVLTFKPPPGAKITLHELTAKWVNEKRKKYVTKASGQGWDGVLIGPSASIAPPADADELDAVTVPVRVGGQDARLFTTDLLNVVFMPDGVYYAGFVKAAALEEAAREG